MLLREFHQLREGRQRDDIVWENEIFTRIENIDALLRSTTRVLAAVQLAV